MLLKEEELKTLFKKQNILKPAQEIINRIRTSPPERRVQSRRGNVCGRYPSKKMGVTIQFESHTAEFPTIFSLEYEKDVLEYYDQPAGKIKLNYIAKTGKKVGVLHTPDFFVIRKNSMGWEECKTEEDLKKLSVKQPNRYVKEEEVWRCPPGIEYAQKYGLYYCVRSTSDINYVHFRNLSFLEDYICNEISISDIAKQEILSIISKNLGINLKTLLECTSYYNFTVDDIYYLIAKGDIFVDLKKFPLVESKKTLVFTDEETAKAFITIDCDPLTNNFNNLSIDLTTSNYINWDNSIWKICNLGDKITLKNEVTETYMEYSMEFIISLIKLGKIKGINKEKNTLQNEVHEIIIKSNKKDLEVANYRHEIIKSIIDEKKSINNFDIPDRTIRFWKKKYVNAEREYGYGYIGLIPRLSQRGNRNRKLSSEVIELLNEYSKKYKTNTQPGQFSIWSQLSTECKKLGFDAPSYKTFAKNIKETLEYENECKRKGPRAAHNFEEFFYDLNRNTPKHGDRPFQICHIDHTELDLELRHSETGKILGRPWVTFLSDAFSRRILAFYLSFDPPSYRSNMMVLRECVRLHNRLPSIIVVDKGTDFNSIYFESFLAMFSCTKKERPTAKPRYGSVCERLFGIVNTRFIHQLTGNTQIMKHVRLATKSNNPKNLAIWTLDKLYEYLKTYCYKVHENLEHPALGQTPLEKFNSAILIYGERKHKLIPYDETFKILTLPTTRKGTAKVQPGHGIKINYLYYWSENFRVGKVENSQIHVRFDPFNLAVAYAYVEKRWIQCISEYYSLFLNHTEKELKIAVAELKKQKQNSSKKYFGINAHNIGLFLNSVDAEEKLLMQSCRDKESKTLLKVIDGGKSKTTNESSFKSKNNISKDNLQILGEF